MLKSLNSSRDDNDRRGKQLAENNLGRSTVSTLMHRTSAFWLWLLYACAVGSQVATADFARTP
jgi:hypothetical protein